MSELKRRFLALFIDYLWIIAYLVILFGIAMGVYFGIVGSIPKFTERGSHLISFLTTVLPITLFFTWKESKEPFATPGKKKVGLRVVYEKNPFGTSLLRNSLKLLPWQLGHMAVIHGLYVDFATPFVYITYGLAIVLPITYILMVILRKDHRHLPDLITRSRVVGIKIMV